MTRKVWICIAVLAGSLPTCLGNETNVDPEVAPTILAITNSDQELLRDLNSNGADLELVTIDEQIDRVPFEPNDMTATEPPAFVLAMLAIFTLLGGRHLVRRR